ncbi:DUF4367 domain-containing protein [Eubacterium sp. am_0171]|uniref:DUF4367 domain-containing protein n=1 Tax=Faecalicatena contorta TaxID=39482 RepID=A0A174IC29_9FIRM|nr:MULTISPECIES: DUF4367 domain-containing protein [Clostridia]MSC83822.1 DUF4367 domain-containing protein [Eubacterium sp. BIOML-A1]MSD06382.1 DUF4367 domain-containing protein [Eubacterium sp. BIOML-A2]RYT20290.1 DUF4367 domain-containing protein [Eubacterium sp. am_0171]CUO82670.1 Uncharacterised protein [[Eubacterium] contortum] [Faecalicatena contorta]
MKQNKKLSLQEEVENAAERVERKIAENPDLKDIQVSGRMEAALLAEIQAYEKRRGQEHSTGENTAEFGEELAPNFTERTKDNPESFLSEEDREALRLGRELLKKKEDEPKLFEVNTEYHKHLNSDEKKGKKKEGRKTSVLRMPRGRRFIIAFAAVLVLVVGTSVTSVGSKSYLKILWEKIHGGQAMQIMNVEDMDTQDSEDGMEVTAYREIREKINILAVRIGTKPKGMYLSEYKIDEEQRMAQLFYKYGDEVIRYTIYLNNSDSSLGQKEEDIKTGEFKVHSLDQDIAVEEYYVKGYADSRYIANFTYKGIHYQLKGILKREELESIIKNLIYFEKET